MNYTKIGIWALVIGVAFLVVWQQGLLAKISRYVSDTQEELKKCTWPTWAELRGSTAVVFVSIVLLGGFVVLVDLGISQLVRLLIT